MTTGRFYQDPPQLGNTYQGDPLLQQYLRRAFPQEMYNELSPDLVRFGHRVVTDILAMAQNATEQEPTLTQFDAWGRRIDKITVAPGWASLKEISAEEGLVAIGYERNDGALSRLHQFAKLYLFNPSSAVYTCPLAMTDGAARLLELGTNTELKRGAFRRLTTRDPSRFWTSGQWMTERSGGSDVSGTETVAKPHEGKYILHGTKWFTSATTSEMAITLARVEGDTKLSAFYLETQPADGSRNGIQVHRLKDKLGTRALPTAELSLLGTQAILLGDRGRGVATIANLINVTRLYNAVCAASGMRRCMALLQDYATRRRVFGKRLKDQPLHIETLAGLEVETQGALHLVFHCITLLGKDECGLTSEDDRAILRLLTPLAKLYTAKQYVAVASEALEGFGGAGYIENTGLPALLRDAQVLSIWEGTTNVLSLNALRAMQKNQSLQPLIGLIADQVRPLKDSELREAGKRIRSLAISIPDAVNRASQLGAEAQQSMAREVAFALSQATIGALMLNHAQWALDEEDDDSPAIAAIRWCRKPSPLTETHDKNYQKDSQRLAFGVKP